MRELTLEFDRGAHVGHLYQTPAEMKSVALQFISDGLERGEYCLYVTSQDSVADWHRELQGFGVDVAGALGRGALEVVTGRESRRHGAFNSITHARDTLHVIDSKLATFPAVRLAGDGWEMEPSLATADVCHWEATANLVFEGLNVRTICQYDLDRYSPEAIHSALRTHPIVLYQGQTYSNPLYEAHRILENEPHLNSSSNDAGFVADLLETMVLAN